jgi:hypothetical protein
MIEELIKLITHQGNPIAIPVKEEMFLKIKQLIASNQLEQYRDEEGKVKLEKIEELLTE